MRMAVRRNLGGCRGRMIRITLESYLPHLFSSVWGQRGSGFTEYFGRTGCRWLYIPKPLSWCGPLAKQGPAASQQRVCGDVEGMRPTGPEHWGMKAQVGAVSSSSAHGLNSYWTWFWDSPNHMTASWVFLLEIWHKSYRLCLILGNLPQSHFSYNALKSWY